MRYLVLGVALLALVAAGCTAATGGSSGGPATPGAASPGAASPAPSAPVGSASIPARSPGLSIPGSAPASPGALSPSVMDPILADAATRSGLAVGDIVVVSAMGRTWSDAGLGCPVPGMVYIQVPVDGYQVVVRAGAVTYDYRGTGPGTFRLCTAAPG